MGKGTRKGSSASDLEAMRAWSEELCKDPVRLKAFLRKVMGPPKRRVEGKEHDELMLAFALMEPVKETNNQHSWCAVYNIGKTVYNVHYFPDEEPFIEEELED